MIYAFKCDCGHTFETRFSFKDIVDFTRCSKCGKFARRVYTPLIHKWKNGQAPWGKKEE